MNSEDYKNGKMKNSQMVKFNEEISSLKSYVKV